VTLRSEARVSKGPSTSGGRRAELTWKDEVAGYAYAPCMILSVGLAALGVAAFLVGVDVLSGWGAGWAGSALSAPASQGLAGVAAILAGAWLAMRIVTGKFAPGTTQGAKLGVLGLAALLAGLRGMGAPNRDRPSRSPSTF
jgi:hypothetical protein